MDEAHAEITDQDSVNEKLSAMKAKQEEAAAVDCAVRILPGVKSMLHFIPVGQYAVAI